MKKLTILFILLGCVSVVKAEECQKLLERYNAHAQSLNQITTLFRDHLKDSSMSVGQWYEQLKSWEGQRVFVPRNTFLILKKHSEDKQKVVEILSEELEYQNKMASDLMTQINKECLSPKR